MNFERARLRNVHQKYFVCLCYAVEVSLGLPRTERFPGILSFSPISFCSFCPLKTLWPSPRLTLVEVRSVTRVKFHLDERLQDPDPTRQHDGFCPLSLDGIEQKIGRGLKDCSCALGTIETENCFQDFFTFPRRVISLCNSLP